MNEKNLYLLSGIPACGKSRWAGIKEYIEKVPVVSRDRIRRDTLIAHNVDSLVNHYFDYENEVFDNYVAKIQEIINKGETDVIADATQINQGSRAKLLNRLDLKGYKVIIVYFNTPLEVCLERNSHREGFDFVPIYAIENMFKKHAPITKEEINKGYRMVEVNG